MGSKLSSWALNELNILFEDGDRSARYPKSNEFLEYGNHPFLNTRNIINGRLDLGEVNFISDHKFSEIKKGRVNTQDVIISTRGSQLGKVAFYGEHKWNQPLINAQLLILRVKDERLLPEYLYLLLNSADGKKQIEMLKSGSAQPQLPVRDLKKFIVNLPDIKTQEQILRLHNSLDKKIILNSLLNQTLEQMAQALFKSWFVDFDPVVDNALDAGFFEQDLAFPDELLRRAEARRAVREHSDFKSLPDTTRQLFPAAFEECAEPSLGLGGWVPQGWKPRPVSSLIDLIGGGTPKTSEDSYWGGDIPWFSVVDAPNDSDVFVIDTEKKVTELGVEKSSTKILRKGTTIISARGTVGKCAVVATPMAMNQSCYGIVSNNGVNDYFIYYLIRQSVSQLQQRSHGSVFSTITRDTFNSFSFSFSGEQIANEFGKIISPWFDKVLSNNRQKSALVSLRDTLLPKLISGELRLDNIATDLAKEGVA